MSPFAGQGMCSGIRDVVNLAWRLDLVLDGKAPDTLLDAYTPERSRHLQNAIRFSVGLGRVICITDPDEAAARDERMMAARGNPELALPPPPPPRLGAPGVFRDEDPAAGLLFIQGRVEHDGRTGLFDDVVGRGFVLLADGADIAEQLGDDARALLRSIGARVVVVAPDADGGGAVVDLDGTYRDWFAEHDASLVLVRPDFYVFDTERVAASVGWGDAECAGLRDTRSVLALDPARLRALRDAVASGQDDLRASGALWPRDGLHLGPPVPDPPKIVCLGLNYRDHAAEAGLQAPAAPQFFAKWANSLIGPTDAIVPPAAATETIDYEAELAVVIGARGRGIDAERALDHVGGVMAFNDVSDRELQMANNLWTGGKAIDTLGPCGPALVLLDEIDDLQALGVRTRVNGQTVQDGTTAAMIFPVAEVVAFLSRIMTLEPSDIIATGTPAGVGNSRDPQLFLHLGDVVEVEIDGIGVLRNPVAEPLAPSAASQNRSEAHAL